MCAESENEARMIHPNDKTWDGHSSRWDGWIDRLNLVIVNYIGKADKKIKKGVVLSSYKAG